MERTAGPEVSGQGGAGADGEQESQCSWSRERGENSTCGLEGQVGGQASSCGQGLEGQDLKRHRKKVFGRFPSGELMIGFAYLKVPPAITWRIDGWRRWSKNGRGKTIGDI